MAVAITVVFTNNDPNPISEAEGVRDGTMNLVSAVLDANGGPFSPLYGGRREHGFDAQGRAWHRHWVSALNPGLRAGIVSAFEARGDVSSITIEDV